MKRKLMKNRKFLVIFLTIFILFSCGEENKVQKPSCGTNKGECSQICTDNDTGYSCSCNSGYALNEDGKTCDDINDCKVDSCPENSECIDGVDSFTCNCDEAYTGDNCDICSEGYELFGDNCLKTPQIVEWGTEKVDIGTDFVIDTDNNIYVIGGTSGAFEGYSNPREENNLFITKFNKERNILWTKQLNINFRYMSFITIDKDNNLYITNSTEENITTQNKGLADILLMKLNSNGEMIWEKLIGSVNDEIVFDIALDSDNNIYTVGYENIITNGSDNIFLSLRKLDSKGDELWVKNTKVYEDDFMKSAYNLAIDKSNNIYVATNTTAHLPVTESNGENDIIIMKYNSNGDVLWIKQYGTEKHDSVNEIIIKNDEIYITGYVNGEFTEFDRYGKGNIFIMKLDNTGEIIFNKVWSDAFNIAGEGIAVSDNNEIYLSGYDEWSDRSMLLFKLNSDGEEIWRKSWDIISSSMNESIDSSILTSIYFNSNNTLYGLGLKDDLYGAGDLESSYNPLLIKFNF